MPSRETSFFNPFNRWPFTSNSPNSSGTIPPASPPACSCNDGGKSFSSDDHQCAARFLHRDLPTPRYEGSPPPPFTKAPASQEPGVFDSPEVPQKGNKGDAVASLKALNPPFQSVKQKDGATRQTLGGVFIDKKVTNPGTNTNTDRLGQGGPTNGFTSTTTHEKLKNNGQRNVGQSRSFTHSSASTNSTAVTEDTGVSWNPASLSSTSQWSPESQGAEKTTEKVKWKDPSPITNTPVKMAVKTSGVQPITHQAHLYAGRMRLGCSHCLFEPRLKLIPCGCLICLQCGAKFWAMVSGGRDVYCGCGQHVLSMVNLGSPTKERMHGVFPQSGHYPPLTFTPSPVSSTVAQFSTPTPIRSHATVMPSEKSNLKARPVNLLSGSISAPLALAATSTNMSKMLMWDADSAVQNAPFVELGRHALAQNWSCVKIGNIPYNITSQEIVEFLGKNANIAPEVAGSMGVHVIMDRSTGKTMDAYVEFISPRDAWKCAFRRRSRVLGNRHLTLDVVDSSELMKDIFPRTKGIVWDGVVPKIVEQSEYGVRKPEIINREELVLIVNHARTPHRSPFSRKCLQRPFQSLMSIVSKFPWFSVDLYTIEQRDFIYHALLSAVDILKRQIKRGRTMPNLDVDLLKSLLRVGLRCSGFTDFQKYELVKAAEFGAEGIQVDSDIGAFGGFEALGKAVGVERKVLEFYGLVLELSLSPFLSDPSSSHGSVLASIFRPRDNDEDSEISKLTMAEAASREWAIIETAIRKVLPAKGFVNQKTDSTKRSKVS